MKCSIHDSCNDYTAYIEHNETMLNCSSLWDFFESKCSNDLEHSVQCFRRLCPVGGSQIANGSSPAAPDSLTYQLASASQDTVLLEYFLWISSTFYLPAPGFRAHQLTIRIYLQQRVKICCDCHDQWTCEFFASCVIFSRKQCIFCTFFCRCIKSTYLFCNNTPCVLFSENVEIFYIQINFLFYKK